MADTKNDSAAPKAAAPGTPRADAPSAAPRAMEKAADAAPKAAEKAAPAPMKEAAKAAAEVAVAPVRAAAATAKAAETAARKPARRTARRTAKATPARASTAKRAKATKAPAKAAPARAAAKQAPKRTRAQAAKAAPAAARTIKTNTVNTINSINEGTRTMKNEAKQAADRFQAVFGDVNERARTAIERNTRIAEEMTELTKGNVEALVASTKVAAKGVETLGQEVAEFNRKSFEDVSAALKSFAEVKSPTDFLRLQTEFARSQFDTVVAETSKLSETMIKLAGEVAQPINSRYSVAAERVRSAVAF
jgi:phasin family protein